MVSWLRLVKKVLSLDVKCICLDNSGENTAFHKLVQYNSEFNIKFECTAPGTQQQNGKDEREFATPYGKTQSMLNAARIPVALRKGLWSICASLSVQLENIIVKEKHEQLASEKVYGTNPKWQSLQDTQIRKSETNWQIVETQLCSLVTLTLMKKIYTSS
jgi:hypothetical protein